MPIFQPFLFYLRSRRKCKIGPGKPGRVSGNEGSLHIYSDDYCTGRFSEGHAEIELSTFDIDKKLDSAYAEGTGTLYSWEWEDWDDTSPDEIVEPINIKVTWTGTGEVYNDRSKTSENISEGTRTYRETRSSNDSSRDAQATGSITGTMTTIEIFDPYANINTGCYTWTRMEKIHKNK